MSISRNDLPNEAQPTSSNHFDTSQLIHETLKGAAITIATAPFTFPLDAWGARALNVITNGQQKSLTPREMFELARTGEYQSIWRHSIYRESLSNYLQHPRKGFAVSFINSCAKNGVLFTAKFMIEKMLIDASIEKSTAQKIAPFMGAFVTTMGLTPISVIKARLMSNVSHAFDWKRSMSGCMAITLRDTTQWGMFFLVQRPLKESYGDTFAVAGASSVIGYAVSNPLNAIGMTQKIAAEAASMPQTAINIYAKNGVKGFYPFATLATCSMFARGVGVDLGSKLFEKGSELIGPGLSSE